MATEIVAPSQYSSGGFSIFLAGAIDIIDWQSWVVNQFVNDDILILNPRRPKFTSDTLDERIKWELQALENATTILLWFPKDAKAPISFFEADLFWHFSKLIVGAEFGFYRRRSLELTSGWHNRHLYSELDEMVWYVRNRFNSR